MTKTKKTFRLNSELDVYPRHYGFSDFSEMANEAIKQLIETRKTPADEAADVVDEISMYISNWQAQRDYPQTESSFSIDQDEFLSALNLVYDLLIRTSIVLDNKKLQVFIDDPMFLEFDEKPYWRHRHAYSSIDKEFLTQLLER
ncbi:MAG: hypothetical protein PF484_10570 [Bacteroidales bacterium]|jgi:hypothetical protein|nr:hypothetical protein [Bacteroidales bacterium]